MGTREAVLGSRVLTLRGEDGSTTFDTQDDNMGKLRGAVETIRATSSSRAARSNESNNRTTLYNIDKLLEQLDGKKYNM